MSEYAPEHHLDNIDLERVHNTLTNIIFRGIANTDPTLIFSNYSEEDLEMGIPVSQLEVNPGNGSDDKVLSGWDTAVSRQSSFAYFVAGDIKLMIEGTVESIMNGNWNLRGIRWQDSELFLEGINTRTEFTLECNYSNIQDIFGELPFMEPDDVARQAQDLNLMEYVYPRLPELLEHAAQTSEPYMTEGVMLSSEQIEHMISQLDYLADQGLPVYTTTGEMRVVTNSRYATDANPWGYYLFQLSGGIESRYFPMPIHVEGETVGYLMTNYTIRHWREPRAEAATFSRQSRMPTHMSRVIEGQCMEEVAATQVRDQVFNMFDEYYFDLYNSPPFIDVFDLDLDALGDPRISENLVDFAHALNNPVPRFVRVADDLRQFMYDEIDYLAEREILLDMIADYLSFLVVHNGLEIQDAYDFLTQQRFYMGMEGLRDFIDFVYRDGVFIEFDE